MRSLFVASSVVLLAVAAYAQSDRGTITGTISDPAGAVVAGAEVEAKNLDTGALYKGASTNTGNYTIAQVPSGTYELSVAVTGFKKFVRPGLIVEVAGTTRADARLEVGATTESVTVEAESPLLKTESGDVSYNITYDKVNQLPIITLGGGAGVLGNVRNPLAVVTLLPGAQFSNDNTLRINGMPSSSQAIRIEGQDATNGIWRQQNQNSQTGVEAIQEVSIQTSNFAAEYGQVGGGYFNYTMKSGSNQYHGGAFDQFVNEALNAGTPFTDAGLTNSQRSGQLVRNAQRRHDYGFTLGGPVWLPKVYNGRDKTFFFFSFEQFRETQVISNGISTVPIAAYLTGDFSGALGATLPLADPLGRTVFQNEIFDPTTSRLAADGSLIRDPFTGNKIPITRIDPVTAKVQALLPTPTNGAKTNNYAIPAYSTFRHSTIPSIKIDHSLSSNIKIAGFFSQIHQASPSANGFTQVFTTAEPQDTTSNTTRINYDQTIRPTLLLHLGAGFLHTNFTAIPVSFDQGALWPKNEQFFLNAFPNIGGLNDIFQGGNAVGLGTGFGAGFIKDIKPTFNASATWVRGNHTFKLGAEAIIEGIPTLNYSRANGGINFGAQQSGEPWEFGKSLNGLTTGFPYASFFLGQTGGLSITPTAETKLGNHSLGMYLQDTWKVTRKLTLDYGLRYDYVTELTEQYGRMQNAAFHLPNPAAGGRLGTVIYEGDGGGRCNCRFQSNYPYAIGPRLGMAYQINSKTVFRGGAGLAYGSAPNDAFLSYSVNDFLPLAPAYGINVSRLQDGNPFAPGNPFGNPPAVYPDFTPRFPVQTQPGVSPPVSVFISIDRNAGKPPRIFQWSLGLQREIARNLVIEAAYVGNRGAWWSAPLLSTYNYNALTPQGLQQTYGLNISNAADRSLLTLPVNSPLVQSRFPNLGITTLPSGAQVVNSVYPGFPATQPLNQALRGYPQWLGIPPFLGPPLGDTWYDSLQAKLTKRLSHGLDTQVAYTWEKELTLGVNSDTSYLTPNPPLINDVFNYAQNKQLSGFSRPQILVVSFNYSTPTWKGDGAGMRALSWAARDWTFGGALRYQSGALIRVPASNNNLLTQLARGPSNNPALWGGGTTFWNQNPGVNPFLADPNCHCFDPTKQLVLNPAAWTDTPAGQFSPGAPYYNNYRWQRQPAESLSVGRNFVLSREHRMNLWIRAEFSNVFNRTYYNAPCATATACNPSAPVTSNNKFANGQSGALSAGYGFINSVNGGGITGAQPRSGQIIARFSF